MDFIHYLYIFFPIFLLLLISHHLLFHTTQNLPPSPSALPILGHLHLLKKPLHRTLQLLSHHHGPILFLKLGFRPVLLLSSPSSVEETITNHDIVFANRPNFLAGKHLGQNYTTLPWVPYNHHWRNLRRITVSEIFSSNRILLSSPLRKEETQSFVKQLIAPTNEWRLIELKTRFFDLVVGIMMRGVAGKIMGVEEKKDMREFLRETFVPNMAMNLGDFFVGLRRFGFLGLEKKLVKLQRDRVEFLQGLIEERRRRRRKRSSNGDLDSEKMLTLIDKLLVLKKTEPDYYTDDVIQGLISIMFTAGTDTSVATMEWTMSLLLNHPEVLDKARTEIDFHVQDNRMIDDADLPNLPYLQCIINEALRLFPVGPLLVPHSSSENCTIGGYQIPRGTTLLINAWAIHRDPKVWAEPDEFKPERFEGVEGEREGFKFIPFGAGRRKCPGAGLSMKMIGLVIGSLVQCFEWKRAGFELVDLTEGGGTTMPKAKPLEALYRPRQCKMNVLSQL